MAELIASFPFPLPYVGPTHRNAFYDVRDAAGPIGRHLCSLGWAFRSFLSAVPSLITSLQRQSQDILTCAASFRAMMSSALRCRTFALVPSAKNPNALRTHSYSTVLRVKHTAPLHPMALSSSSAHWWALPGGACLARRRLSSKTRHRGVDASTRQSIRRSSGIQRRVRVRR